MLIKRKCSECGKEVEYERIRRYRANLFFCSEGCSKRFWERDAKKRAELGWSPLRDEEGNVAFPIEAEGTAAED